MLQIEKSLLVMKPKPVYMNAALKQNDRTNCGIYTDNVKFAVDY